MTDYTAEANNAQLIGSIKMSPNRTTPIIPAYCSGSKITIETKYNQNLIIQEVNKTNQEGTVFEQLIRNVIALQEEGIRKALIELGWTPPPKKLKEEK